MASTTAENLTCSNGMMEKSLSIHGRRENGWRTGTNDARPIGNGSISRCRNIVRSGSVPQQWKCLRNCRIRAVYGNLLFTQIAYRRRKTPELEVEPVEVQR